jgi:hypothetical protein
LDEHDNLVDPVEIEDIDAPERPKGKKGQASGAKLPAPRAKAAVGADKSKSKKNPEMDADRNNSQGAAPAEDAEDEADDPDKAGTVKQSAAADQIEISRGFKKVLMKGTESESVPEGSEISKDKGKAKETRMDPGNQHPRAQTPGVGLAARDLGVATQDSTNHPNKESKGKEPEPSFAGPKKKATSKGKKRVGGTSEEGAVNKASEAAEDMKGKPSKPSKQSVDVSQSHKSGKPHVRELTPGPSGPLVSRTGLPNGHGESALTGSRAASGPSESLSKDKGQQPKTQVSGRMFVRVPTPGPVHGAASEESRDSQRGE